MATNDFIACHATSVKTIDKLLVSLQTAIVQERLDAKVVLTHSREEARQIAPANSGGRMQELVLGVIADSFSRSLTPDTFNVLSSFALTVAADVLRADRQFNRKAFLAACGLHVRNLAPDELALDAADPSDRGR